MFHKDNEDDFNWLDELGDVEVLDNENIFVDNTPQSQRKVRKEDEDNIREAHPQFDDPNAFLKQVSEVEIAGVEEPFIGKVRENELLCAHRASLGKDQIALLKKGLMPFEAKLDLHGKREDEASGALLEFLNKSYAVGMRCVLIVHGKGKGYGEHGDMGVIKANVSMWLECSKAVLAYYTAQPKHGGSGALYVLLRRNKKNEWLKDEDIFNE